MSSQDNNKKRNNQNASPSDEKKKKISSGSLGEAIDAILKHFRDHLENPNDQVVALNSAAEALGFRGKIVRAYAPPPEEALVSTLQRFGVLPGTSSQLGARSQQVAIPKAGTPKGKTTLPKQQQQQKSSSKGKQVKQKQPLPLFDRDMPEDVREQLVVNQNRLRELQIRVSQRRQTNPKVTIPSDDADCVEIHNLKQWIKTLRADTKDAPKVKQLPQPSTAAVTQSAPPTTTPAVGTTQQGGNQQQEQQGDNDQNMEGTQ